MSPLHNQAELISAKSLASLAPSSWARFACHGNRFCQLIHYESRRNNATARLRSPQLSLPCVFCTRCPSFCASILFGEFSSVARTIPCGLGHRRTMIKNGPSGLSIAETCVFVSDSPLMSFRLSSRPFDANASPDRKS